MKLFIPFHAVMLADKQIGGWVVWSPEFDIVTQGDNVEHARRMLGDALRLAAESDLLDNIHPLRRGIDAYPHYELTEHFEKFSSSRNSYISVELSELEDGADDVVILTGDVDVRTGCGVIDAVVTVYSTGYVLGENYVISLDKTVTHSYSYPLKVRASHANGGNVSVDDIAKKYIANLHLDRSDVSDIRLTKVRKA